MSQVASRTGGQVLIDQLRIHGTDTIFGVPGESYLAALDALYDAPDMRFIVCRHEAGAANMAEAHGKLTGMPGICFVTRGPGATHASIGVHTAFQDSTPMILLIGQVARDMMEREAFQEIDYRQMFGPMTKWVAQIDDAARVPELVARAFSVATSGRPGPVVLALPEDMLTDVVDVADARRYAIARPGPSPDAMSAVREALAMAKRPLILVGGRTWGKDGAADLAAFASAHGIPVVATFRSQDILDNRHPCYVGHLGIGADKKLVARVKAADLLLAIGTRLGEATTNGYTILKPPILPQMLIHVFPDPEELSRVYQPDLGIVADSAGFVAAARRWAPLPTGRWSDWTSSARADYEAFCAPPPCDDPLDLSRVIQALRRGLPDNAIVTNGAGNFAGWLHRFFDYRIFPSQLAPTNGAMGYGVPAAIAAVLVSPERRAVVVAGDGDFIMSSQELATAAHYRLPILFVVVNNGMFGTIRMHQEREYPARPYGTGFTNPDFVALAHSYGMFAARVSETHGFDALLAEALAFGGPALIELVTNPETISPGNSITAMRAAAKDRT